MEIIPKILYRGDSDHHSCRNLRIIQSHGCLLTNLSNSGDGREIFSTSLRNVICKHVTPGWTKTHFLSFSECPDIAFRFATGESGKKLVDGSVDSWDAVVIYLCKDKFTSIIEVCEGIYKCQFNGGLPVGILGSNILRIIENYFNGTKTVTILLIDVATYLATLHINLDVEKQIKLAKKYREWLVLPIDFTSEIPGEFVSQLDDGCFSKVDFYKYSEN
jgi:hypothetical protein